MMIKELKKSDSYVDDQYGSIYPWGRDLWTSESVACMQTVWTGVNTHRKVQSKSTYASRWDSIGPRLHPDSPTTSKWVRCHLTSTRWWCMLIICIRPKTVVPLGFTDCTQIFPAPHFKKGRQTFPDLLPSFRMLFLGIRYTLRANIQCMPSGVRP